MTKIKKTCDHDTCPPALCHFGRLAGLGIPTDLTHYERERPLWAIEQSGVRVGQRYKSWQHGITCRILAVGLATWSRGGRDDDPIVAFEDEDGHAAGVTFCMPLKQFKGTIAGHNCWELLP